jgi:rubrerythrin
MECPATEHCAKRRSGFGSIRPAHRSSWCFAQCNLAEVGLFASCAFDPPSGTTRALLTAEMTMSPRTKRNLNTAMQTEALAHAEYLRFAARARANENWDLAQLFQVAADTGRTEHFAQEADLAGLVTNDCDNLRHAVEEKRAGAVMYQQFAKEAVAEGDFAAAALFEKIQTAAANQREAFEAAFLIQAQESAAGLVEV